MPAFNAGKHIKSAIQSVLEQQYQNWELIIINDGSTDNTRDEILSFIDPRINLLEQGNQGVSKARNHGLKKMSGDFFCFLDADDKLTPISISERLNILLENEEVYFVDGWVDISDQFLKLHKKTFKPTFKGHPKMELAWLKPSCYFGITWMIRRKPGYAYEFPTKQTHGEDLLFFLSIADMGKYDYINKSIYIYRQQPLSAMANLQGLEKGYVCILSYIKKHDLLNSFYFSLLKLKVGKIMLLSFLKQKKISDGIRSFWLFLVSI